MAEIWFHVPHLYCLKALACVCTQRRREVEQIKQIAECVVSSDAMSSLSSLWSCISLTVMMCEIIFKKKSTYKKNTAPHAFERHYHSPQPDGMCVFFNEWLR